MAEQQFDTGFNLPPLARALGGMIEAQDKIDELNKSIREIASECVEECSISLAECRRCSQSVAEDKIAQSKRKLSSVKRHLLDEAWTNGYESAERAKAFESAMGIDEEKARSLGTVEASPRGFDPTLLQQIDQEQIVQEIDIQGPRPPQPLPIQIQPPLPTQPPPPPPLPEPEIPPPAEPHCDPGYHLEYTADGQPVCIADTPITPPLPSPCPPNWLQVQTSGGIECLPPPEQQLECCKITPPDLTLQVPPPLPAPGCTLPPLPPGMFWVSSLHRLALPVWQRKPSCQLYVTPRNSVPLCLPQEEEWVHIGYAACASVDQTCQVSIPSPIHCFWYGQDSGGGTEEGEDCTVNRLCVPSQLDTMSIAQLALKIDENDYATRMRRFNGRLTRLFSGLGTYERLDEYLGSTLHVEPEEIGEIVEIQG